MANGLAKSETCKAASLSGCGSVAQWPDNRPRAELAVHRLRRAAAHLGQVPPGLEQPGTCDYRRHAVARGVPLVCALCTHLCKLLRLSPRGSHHHAHGRWSETRAPADQRQRPDPDGERAPPDPLPQRQPLCTHTRHVQQSTLLSTCVQRGAPQQYCTVIQIQINYKNAKIIRS